MKNILVIILSIFFYPPLRTQEIICTIIGSIFNGDYVFNLNELPQRCNAFTVSQYCFNPENNKGVHYREADKVTLRCLVEAGKTVYTDVGFAGEEWWSDILEFNDECKYKTEIIDPLINFINKFKINGITLSFYEKFFITGIEDFPTKIKNFISIIKERVNNIKVGMSIYGDLYTNFTNKKAFDFTITNRIVDYYVINLSALNDCGKDTKIIGLSPVTTTTPNTIITIEQVTTAVTCSAMDKSKIFAELLTATLIPDDLIGKDDIGVSSYSTYCSSTNPIVQSRWCTNPSNVSYDQGVYVKKFYAGIFIQQFETDDSIGNCGCVKFPVLNLIIDGWTGTTFKACPKLDKC